MKTSFLVFLVGAIIVAQTSCVKKQESCTLKTVQSEEPAIIAYAANNGITATRDSTGLYYEIISPGSGTTPNDNSTIFVTYTGKLLSGAVFDQQTNAAQTGWQLGGLISGWRIGLPLIQKGGRIKLIIPSSLAYGCGSNGLVGPNSILYFDIELVDVH